MWFKKDEDRVVTTHVKDEWIWVEGFKGTNKDMTCRDYQYELGKQFDISEDREVEMCEHGFHLCHRLVDVFNYYGFDHNNRFFKVRALVRKKDFDHYYSYTERDESGRSQFFSGNHKLVASSIIFTEELSTEYLCEYFGIQDWSDEYKTMARELGIGNAQNIMREKELVNLGYSETFAKTVIVRKKYDIAAAVGSLPDLSMDMKVWTIFNS